MVGFVPYAILKVLKPMSSVMQKIIGFVPYGISRFSNWHKDHLKLTRSKSVLYYVLFPTAFSRFSNCTFTPEYFLSSFAPYSILKDLKLSIQELGSSFVLYPTALSRFSNGFYYSLSYGLFCTLRHFQGSQARR